MSSKLGAIAAGEVIITGGAEVVVTTMVGGIIAVTGDLISDHSDEAASVVGLFLIHCASPRQPGRKATPQSENGPGVGVGVTPRPPSLGGFCF